MVGLRSIGDLDNPATTLIRTIPNPRQSSNPIAVLSIYFLNPSIPKTPGLCLALAAQIFCKIPKPAITIRNYLYSFSPEEAMSRMSIQRISDRRRVDTPNVR